MYFISHQVEHNNTVIAVKQTKNTRLQWKYTKNKDTR